MNAIDETEREQALLGNIPDDPTLNTYRRGGSRSLNAILKIVKTMQVSLGRVGLAARLGFPRRQNGESKDEFNDRVAEFQQQRKMAQEQDLR